MYIAIGVKYIYIYNFATIRAFSSGKADINFGDGVACHDRMFRCTQSDILANLYWFFVLLPLLLPSSLTPCETHNMFTVITIIIIIYKSLKIFFSLLNAQRTRSLRIYAVCVWVCNIRSFYRYADACRISNKLRYAHHAFIHIILHIKLVRTLSLLCVRCPIVYSRFGNTIYAPVATCQSRHTHRKMKEKTQFFGWKSEKKTASTSEAHVSELVFGRQIPIHGMATE